MQQTETTTETSTSTETVAGGQEAVVDEDSAPTIVKLAAGNKDLSTLVTAVEAAGLTTSLSNAGPFTVFAPVNAAFDKLPKGTVEGLLEPDKKDALEINRYKNELQKLKNFLLDKLEEYPEIAKEISNDLNIVTKEINTVNSIAPDEKQISKGGSSDVQLNVNDNDLYEDANRNREEQEEIEEREKSRGFRR